MALQDPRYLEYFLLKIRVNLHTKEDTEMLWIIGSMALVLFAICLMCMLIVGGRADEISRIHFAKFFMTKPVAERAWKEDRYGHQGGGHL